MANGLEVRICTLKEIKPPRRAGVQSVVAAGGGHSSGTDAIVNKILALEFEGPRIKTELSDFRKAVQQAMGQGFPASDLLVIGAARGIKAGDLEVAASRALAVKTLLLALGVPARNIAADDPGPILRASKVD